MRAILFVACLLAACGAATRESETLTESIRSFNESVRWQRYAVAAAALPAPARAKFVDEMDERGNDLKITDYEVIKVENHGARAAQVQVKLSWYRESEGTLRETHAMQSWEQRGRSWLMVDESRLRGAEMPGLPEAMMKE